IENTSDNTSHPDTYQPIIIETKMLENKEVNEYLDSKDKERVSNMIRERNSEKINEFIFNNKGKIKTAKSLVNKEVKQLLSDITEANLQQKTLKARKIYNLFNSIEIVKIKQ
ncbi:14993_t:CDS:2, partial [Racocetra fulgida]